MLCHMQGPTDFQAILLQLLASLTFAETLGDVADEVLTVLGRLGIELEDGWDWQDEVRRTLAKLGVTTLHGTSLGDDDE